MGRMPYPAAPFIAWFPAVILVASVSAFAGTFVELEAGSVFSGYNDVRIPGKGGTLLSLSRELSSDAAPYGRVRLGRSFGGSHEISFLAAPLRLEASGITAKEVVYMGESFPSGTALTSRYRFDSYRLTYRWDGLRRRRLKAGIGFTAKIRDASISLSGGGRNAEKRNTGFVPIVNFRLEWTASERILALLEGDALAAPQGRAEDVFAGAAWRMGKRTSVKAGYRILEGGADNEEVYTFSLFHYAALGVIVQI